jgi:hypothetical protein
MKQKKRATLAGGSLMKTKQRLFAYCLRRRRIRNAEAPMTPRAIVLGSGTTEVPKLKLVIPAGRTGTGVEP